MKTTIKAVFDNGGETLDRYTIVMSDGDMIGASENGLGFLQYVGNMVDAYMVVSYGYAWRRQCDVDKVIKNTLPELISNHSHLGKRIRVNKNIKNIIARYYA